MMPVSRNVLVTGEEGGGGSYLVGHEGRQVAGLGGIVLGEGADLTAVLLRPLLGLWATGTGEGVRG